MNQHQALLDVVDEYLLSIYKGDPDGLRAVFHPCARIEDQISGSFRSRSPDEYIQAVESRLAPLDRGEPFSMAPISVQVLGDVASVTAELRFLGNHFYNVLSLLRVDGHWRIVHKLYTPAVPLG